MAGRDGLSRQLREACERGQLETARKVVSRGADPSYKDIFGYTPLHEASRYIHVYM